MDVDAGSDGQRIDNFLARELKGVPRGHLHRLLRRGEVRVNGGRARSGRRLRSGDRVRIPPVTVDADGERGGTPPDGMVQRLRESILHEEETFLVIDKPGGVAVHAGSGVRWGVIEALRTGHPAGRELELVHRLDRETSGCLLVAKRRSALRRLNAIVREGRLEKRYMALLRGRLPKGPVPVEARLDVHARRGGERTVQVTGEGQWARSVFQRSELYPGATLAEVAIETGRTHQIRVHAAHLGHPIGADTRYGDPDWNAALRASGLRRLFLHASAVGWTDPDSGDRHFYHCPLPGDLRATLEQLGSGPGATNRTMDNE